MYLIADTIDDLLRKSQEVLLDQGIKETSTRGEYFALPGVLLELTNPLARLSRTESRGKIVSCIGELMWILSGSNALHAIAPYISKYIDESEDGETIHGAYGPRIFSTYQPNQFHRAAELLHLKPSSRRAVIPILAQSDFDRDHKEIPCTLQLHFRILENKLHLFVSMRSSDAFLGLPHDIFVFTMLQEIMARHLSVELGSYKHFAGDLHVYTEHIPKVNHFLSEGWTSRLNSMPIMPAEGVMDTVAMVVQAESHIRQNHSIPLVCNRLSSYWNNLLGFIGMHFARQQRDKESAKLFRAMIDDPVYQIYVFDRELNE